MKRSMEKALTQDLYTFMRELRSMGNEVKEYAATYGFYELLDRCGAHIDCHIIDTARLDFQAFHPELRIDTQTVKDGQPIILVMDYAFGTQAFELIDSLLQPVTAETGVKNLKLCSMSVMGKAGTVVGKKGDIMIATAHVLEGSAENYIFDNDLREEDFEGYKDVFVGPIITVLGTSLQNRDVLETFRSTSWKAVGLEMEGGHYQRAINAAIIREHVSKDVKVRYAYYASDNPLKSGQTLASGSLRVEGVKPIYLITKCILEKIVA